MANVDRTIYAFIVQHVYPYIASYMTKYSFCIIFDLLLYLHSPGNADDFPIELMTKQVFGGGDDSN